MFSVTVFTNSSRYTVNNNNLIIGLGDLLVNTRQDVWSLSKGGSTRIQQDQ